MSKEHKIGIDLGGTNVKIALVDNAGHIAYSNSVPTGAEMGYEYTISNIKQLVYISPFKPLILILFKFYPFN